jgi:hypothetical protein
MLPYEGYAIACQRMAPPCSASNHYGHKRTTYPKEIYTNGSKDAGKVGAEVAIYSNKQLVIQFKYNLQNCCCNNQAEQIAIL